MRRDAGIAGETLIVGRERERRLLDRLVDSADYGGAAAVLAGEAGMGRSSLLAYVEARALRRHARVVNARGVEAETVLSFATITDLLMPLRRQFGRLPSAQREALEECLALSPGSAHGRLAACAGALGIFAGVAEESGLVVLIDDFQWVDPESRQILSFAARRLETERVVMIFAVREEPDRDWPVLSLPVLRLAGLSYADCAQIARRQQVDISPVALRSLIDWSGGNPLAVVEQLGVAAAGVHHAGASELPWPPTFHPSLERTWGRILRQLPDDTRHALFVMAADRAERGRHTAAALGTLGLSLQSLAAAERMGLVRVTDDEISLRHPLMRSAVLARTPLAVKAAAYRALAAAADGYLRTWYLAAAATCPAPGIADALVAAAGNARERGGYGASAQILRRAAELTEERQVRAERLLRAASDAHMAGDSLLAVGWCEEALRCRRDPAFAGEVARVMGRARSWLGDPSRGLADMVRAAAIVRPADPARAAEILAEAAIPAAMGGHAHLVRDIAEQIEETWKNSQADSAAAPPMVLAMVAGAFVMSGELDRARPHLNRAAALPTSADLGADQRGTAFLAQNLAWAERYGLARKYIAGVVDAGRRMGAPAELSFSLAVSAELQWWAGQWPAAYADATEALQWAEGSAQTGLIGYSLAVLSRIEAARGDRERCEAHVERARQEVERRGIGCLGVQNSAALGLAALGAGDLVAAAEHLERGWAVSRAQGLGNPNIVPVAGDLAEALARAGALDGAERVITWLDEQALSTGLAYPRAAACRARGIVAREAGEAEIWFARARASGDLGTMPFEEARTLLCQGEAMRRARSPTAARRPLQNALAMFDSLGARVWAASARAELAATGAKLGPAADASMTLTRLGQLSPQELRVGRAVACGLSNVEVAAALFLSPKTVEAHLTRAYRKLEVRSRTELARVLLAHGISD